MLIPLGFIGGLDNGWLARLGNDSSDQFGQAVTLDSSGNFYAAGSTTESGTRSGLIAKYDNDGVIQWQRRLTTSSVIQYFGIGIDSSANLYVAGTDTTGIMIAKYNSSGSIQWQKRIGSSGVTGRAIKTDSSGNSYVVGGNQSSTGAVLIKLDSSGSITWQRKLTGGTNTEVAFGVGTDTSGNVYVVGNGFGNLFASKYNSSGTIQWQRTISLSGIMSGAAVDDSGNVYYTGRTDTSIMILGKFTSTGTLDWQRELGTAGNTEGFGVAVDNAGSVYFAGFGQVSGRGSEQLIAKYSTSGTLTWQRSLGEAGSDTAYGLGYDSRGFIVVTGRGFANDRLALAKLPEDGSGLGTVSLGGFSIQYATSSFTNTTTTYSDSAGTMTDSAGSLSASTTTYTDAATTLTSNARDLP